VDDLHKIHIEGWLIYMREATVKVFSFEELAPEVQKKVIERYRNKESFCWDSCDSDNLTEYFREKAKDGGFDDDVKVLWSLSSCQGDGVAFEGDYKITDSFITNHGDSFNYAETRRMFWLVKQGLKFRVRNGGRYSHYNSMSYECYCDYEDNIKGYVSNEKLVIDLIEKLYPLVKQEVQALSKECERAGYDDMDSHTTDEYIKDALIGNEYEFTEEGRDWSF
jgi:hypothetical protein